MVVDVEDVVGLVGVIDTLVVVITAALVVIVVVLVIVVGVGAVVVIVVGVWLQPVIQLSTSILSSRPGPLEHQVLSDISILKRS